MIVELPYGREKKVALEIPEENLGFVVDRSEAPALRDPREELRRNLRNPIGTPSLSDMVHPRDHIVVVVDDVTRPTPQRVLLPVLLDELNTFGVPDKNIELIIALGTHRKLNQKERAALGYNENLEAIEKGEIDDLIAGGGLLLHAQILERAEVICYSGGLTEGDKEALGFKHADTSQEAVEMALESQGKNAKIGILKCGEILPLIN